MSADGAQRHLRCLRALEVASREDTWRARNLCLTSRVLTARKQDAVGVKGRLGLCRESGGGDWPMFTRLPTGAAKPLAEALASPETRGA
jgi:hypothetical protein